MDMSSSSKSLRQSQSHRVENGALVLGKSLQRDNSLKSDDGFASKKSQSVDSTLPIRGPPPHKDLASSSRVTAFADANKPFDMRETPQEWVKLHGSKLREESKQKKTQKAKLSAKEKKETELGPIIHRPRTRTSASREPASEKKPTPNKKKTRRSDESWVSSTLSSLSSSQTPEDKSSGSSNPTKEGTPEDTIRVEVPSVPNEEADDFADVFTGSFSTTENSLPSHGSTGYYLGTGPYFPGLMGREDEKLERLVDAALQPGMTAYRGSDPFVSPGKSLNTATPTRRSSQRGTQFDGGQGRPDYYFEGK